MVARAAVQRAAERADLDRNDYSAGALGQEGASVLSPGGIALVNGRTNNADMDVHLQLRGEPHFQAESVQRLCRTPFVGTEWQAIYQPTWTTICKTF